MQVFRKFYKILLLLFVPTLCVGMFIILLIQHQLSEMPAHERFNQGVDAELTHETSSGQGSAQVFVQMGHSESVLSVAFSNNGKYILSGGKDKILILWDAPTGREIRKFEGHTSDVNSVAFSYDG